MKGEPARIAIRKKILQHEKHPIKYPEEGLGKTHPFLVKELKKTHKSSEGARIFFP